MKKKFSHIIHLKKLQKTNKQKLLTRKEEKEKGGKKLSVKFNVEYAVNAAFMQGLM